MFKKRLLFVLFMVTATFMFGQEKSARPESRVPLNPEVKIGTVTSAAGTVLIPLEMLSFTQNVNSFTFKIVVDPTHLQFVSLENKVGFTVPNYQAFQNGNTLSIVYYDPGNGYMPNGRIFDMKFTFSGTATTDLTFQLSQCEVTAGIFPITNITYTNGQVVAIPTSGFTITASAGPNGSISPSGAVSVPENGNQSFTISPATGYHVADVLVDGVSVGAVTSYTFSNVTANHTIAASFAIETFTITATAGANGSISPAGTTTVNYGGSQTYTITPATGYSVADVLVDGVSVGAVSSYTFNNVMADHTIEASFTNQTFTITATAGANGSISPAGTTTVNYGASQTYTITPATGYSVADVLVDGVSVGAVASYTFTNVTANHTIAASFTNQTFTITATAGANGSISPAGTTTVNYGASQTYTITPATGYSVADVLVDGVSVGAVTSYTFSNVTANHTIAANFAINTFTITATAGANGSISPAGTTTVNYGGSQTYTITPATGYSVADVLVDGVSVGTVTSYTFSNVTANHTISASFTNQTFTITATAGANGSISPAGTTTVNYGASQTYTITPATGYSVADVLVDGVSVGAVTSYTFSNVTANHTIAASFAINNFTITATAGANGSISPAGTTTVNFGGSQTYTITPGIGYHVADVLVDGVSVGAVTSYTFSNVTANHTIAASFAINTFTITATAGANGSISPAGTTTVNYGASQTYTITPATGYSVADVLVDGVSVGAVTSYTFSNVTANHAIAASFAIQYFTINASAGSNGSISPAGNVTVNYGASQSFTIVANTGYHIDNVLVDGVSVGPVNSYTFSNVTANHTIAASFAADTFTITATAGANGIISPAGTTTVNYGASQTYTITPATGYHVADVLVDGVSVGAVTTYTFNNVTSNHTIAASFAIDTFTITATAGTNGNISPSGTTTVNYGGSQAYTITPSTGYHVADVLVDGVSVGAVTSYTFSNVTANHTIAASFAIDTFTITATSGENGAILPFGTVSVEYGENQTFQFLPASGYQVYAYYVDGDSIGNQSSYTFENVMADHTIHVTFSLIIGINENDEHIEMNVWPNPATTFINLNIKDLTKLQNPGYAITTTEGKVVDIGNINSAQSQISLSSVKPGPFVLQVYGDNKIIKTLKMIKL